MQHSSVNIYKFYLLSGLSQWLNYILLFCFLFQANCIILAHGVNAGFLSPALPLLLSDKTPLSTGPLTTTEVSWLGAITSFGSVCGSFIYGVLSIKLGSKRSMVYLSFPPITFWCLIMFGHTFYHILIARAIAGLLGGGFYSCVILFISETANDEQVFTKRNSNYIANNCTMSKKFKLTYNSF